MVITAFAHRGEDRDRHRQFERAGKIDHEEGERPLRISRKQPSQGCASQGPGNERICKVGRPALRRGLEFFRLFDHIYDLVIAAGTQCFPDVDLQLAFFQNGSCIDVSAGFLADRERFAGHGGLIDSAFPCTDYAVKRDDVSCPHYDMVSRHNFADGYEYFFAVLCFDPCVVDVYIHAAGKVVNGLLVGPVFQEGARIQQEHDRPGGRPASAQDGDGNRRRVQNGDLEFPFP